MAYGDNTTNAAFIPVNIAQKALGYFGAYLNLAKTVAKDWEYDQTTVGATIQVPKRGALSVNSKAANSPVVVQNPTATNISVTLNTHPEVTFGIDNVTQVLQNQNTMAGYAKDAALVLGESLESSIAGLYASLSATPITFDNTSDATTDASVRAIRKYFVDQRVPQLETRNAYVGSSTYNALLGVQKFTQAQQLGLTGQGKSASSNNTPSVDAALLDIYKMGFFESQLAVSTGTTPTIVEHNIAYTHDAFILASRPLPDVPEGYGAVSEVVVNEDTGMGLRVVSSFNPAQLAMQITLDLLYGVAVNDNRRAVGFNFTHA